MALYDDLEEINLGNAANDGTGDDLREAFRKTKASIEFLYNSGYAPTYGANIGATGVEVYAGKVGTDLQFRKIEGLDAIKITVVNDVITTEFLPTAPVDFNGQDITNFGTAIGYFEGTLRGLVGGVTGTLVDASDLNNKVNTFDYGSFNETFYDPISYLLREIGTDMGSFTNPSSVDIDAGTIA